MESRGRACDLQSLVISTAGGILCLLADTLVTTALDASKDTSVSRSRHNKGHGQAHPETLSAISEALSWPFSIVDF